MPLVHSASFSVFVPSSRLSLTLLYTLAACFYLFGQTRDDRAELLFSISRAVFRE